MPKMNLPLSRQVFVNSASNPNGQLLQNMYSVPNVVGETSEYTLRQRYGSKLFFDTGQIIRGFAVIKDLFYVVGDSTIKVYNSIGVLTASYAFVTSPGQYYKILDNAVGQIAFLDSVSGTYRVLESGTLYSPSFPSGWTSNTFVYMGGYFIFNRTGTQEFFISSLLDGRTFNALDFSTAVEKSDNIVGLATTSGHLYIFGTDSIEIFQNTGNSDFPFEKINGTSNTTVGAFNSTSIISELGSVFFLSRDSGIYQINGYSVDKISTITIDTKIKSILNNATTVRSYVFIEYGMYFYAITIVSNTGSGFTFCYNLNTKEWHTRKTAGYDYWNIENPLTFNNNSYGVVSSGIYELTNTEFKDVFVGNDLSIERVFTSEFIDADGKRIIHHSIQPMITTNLNGNAFDSGFDSSFNGTLTQYISMCYSDDGGFSYSTPRILMFGGNITKGRKIEFRNLGLSRKRIYKFEVDDDIDVSVSSCKIRIEVENEE